MSTTTEITIRSATTGDVGLILAFIRELANYERLSDLCVATEDALRQTLFGPRPTAEVLLADAGGAPAGFALYFQNYSTFLARPGLYLEDLFVRPAYRRLGVGRALLIELAAVAGDRGCGRFEWNVLDWNVDARRFYDSLGAVAMSEWMIYRLTGEALEALARDGRASRAERGSR
ncbi:MAG: GNAT family N-acetyltransferase [Vicinamibacterales bacterium]